MSATNEYVDRINHIRRLRLSVRLMCAAGMRWKRRAATMLLYFLLSQAILAPLASRDILPASPALDLFNHLSGIIEARSALQEGQFPIRVAPTQNEGRRYPIFQFYSNLPYFIGGVLFLVFPSDPYQVFKWILAGGLTLAGVYTYRSAYALYRRRIPALIAGAAFISAPYMLTDVYGRFAYPELIAFCLLPAVFFYAWRSFVRRNNASIVMSGLTWSALACSHNIIFLYASFFLGVCFLLHVRLSWRYVVRMLRVGVAVMLGLLLSLWYVAPPIIYSSQLAISAAKPRPEHAAFLNPFPVLVAPALLPHDPIPARGLAENNHFGLQVGWIILVAVGVVAWRLFSATRLPVARQVTSMRLLALFGIAFVMVWSPVNFWQFLPSIFLYVQFPYRLLTFCTLWGSLLVAGALASYTDRQLTPWALIIALLLMGLFMSSYLEPLPRETRTTLDQEIAFPNMGRAEANHIYVLQQDALVDYSARSDLPFVDANSLADVVQRGDTTEVRLAVNEPSVVQAPVFFYPDMLEVRVNGRKVPYASAGLYVAVEVPQGESVIEVRFTGLPWANMISGAAWVAAGAVLSFTSIRSLVRVRKGT